MDEINKNPVFVYGILKGRDGAVKGWVPQYRLIDMGWFPAAIPAGFDQKIEGELIYVDDATIEEFDRIESAPDFYQRVKVEVEILGEQMEPGSVVGVSDDEAKELFKVETVEAEMYVVNRDYWAAESLATPALKIREVSHGATIYEYN